VVDPDELLRLTENVLRELIEVLMRDAYGSAWFQHLGVTSERINQWERRRDDEGRRRTGTTVEDRLLWYSDFTDLWRILKANWELFEPCFGNQNRLEVYLDRLAGLRNPGAHARQLVPFEAAIVVGMAGEIRQQVTIFRSQGGTGEQPEYFPRIEELRDSFGTKAVGRAAGGRRTPSHLVLNPGDTIVFSGDAWDPANRPIAWDVRVITPGVSIFSGTGERFSAEWEISELNVGEAVIVVARVTSDRPYHRNRGFDDEAQLTYKVLPLTEPG